MNGHAAESISHLTETGVEAANAAIEKSTMHDLDASLLKITKTSTLRAVPEPNSAEVWASKSCTDHMVTVTWTADYGWHAPEIKPYGPISMMPTASCLHYATECFEGMKVYRGFDGKLRLFRPDKNCNRLVMSSTRVALPSFNPLELEKLIKALMKLDGARWLPKSQPGSFLYLRPAIIGNGEELGVPKGPPGLKLLASKNDVRAWPGGFGYAKVGANYGPAFVAHMEGRKQGYDQILWLLGPDYQVTEAGASNFFLIWKTKEGALQLITAPLDGKIILDGVTRRSVLELARERLVKGSKFLSSELQGLEIVERMFSMLEVVEAQKEGRLVEAFVSGTAYFITAISAVNFRDEELQFPMGDGEGGHYGQLLKKWLTDIKYGNESHEWGVIVDEE